MNQIEEKVEGIILRAYANNGYIEMPRDDWRKLKDIYSLLERYCDFSEWRSDDGMIHKIKLKPEYFEFAKNGAFYGEEERRNIDKERAEQTALLTNKQIKDIDKARRRSNLSLIISAIAALASLIAASIALCR